MAETRRIDGPMQGVMAPVPQEGKAVAYLTKDAKGRTARHYYTSGVGGLEYRFTDTEINDSTDWSDLVSEQVKHG